MQLMARGMATKCNSSVAAHSVALRGIRHFHFVNVKLLKTHPLGRLGYDAEVRLGDRNIVRAELHWYEPTGIGKREFKIRRFL